MARLNSIFKNAVSFSVVIIKDRHKGLFCFGRNYSQWYMGEYFLRSVAKLVIIIN